MTRDRVFYVLLTLPLLFSAAALSQQPATASQPPQPVGPARVTLNVVVTAKNGLPVSGLQPQDFKLLVNGAPTPIASFQPVAGDQAPVKVTIVVDAINIPYTGVSYTRGQIESFLRANEGRLQFPTAVAVVTDTGTQMQHAFSKDGNAEADMLEHANIGLREDNRSAGFWGAAERLEYSTNALRDLIAREAQLPGRKFILWVSHGWPLLSGPEMMLDDKQEQSIFTDVVGFSYEFRRGNETLYNIDAIGPTEGLGRTFYYMDFLKGVSKLSQVDLADLSVQVLSTHSGGLVLTSSNDVVGELQKCVADGTAYYEITFVSPPADRRDQYRAIDVKVARPGLTARTLQGYYAQP